MALYVYVTEECRKDAKRHSCDAQVEKFQAQVVELQCPSRFDHFPPPYLKKRFERQIRLVANFKTFKINDEDHIVITFLRIFIRGNAEYIRFKSNPVAFGERHFATLVTDEQLEEYLRMMLDTTPIPQLSLPTDIEYGYLYSVQGNAEEQATDEKICESETWVKFTSIKANNYLLLTICTQLLEIHKNPEVCRWKDPKRDLYVVYRILPKHAITFLAGLARNEGECIEIEDRYKEILQAETDPDVDLVLRNSFRAYPTLLTADENLWVGIQEDKEANLSLSPEEASLLDGVHHEKGNNSRYPLFINGRAGSGKSTILYFLFADYVGHYLNTLKENIKVPAPILLSCSDELVRRARETVTNVLRSHYKRKIAGSKFDSNDEQEIKPCFENFHKFLHNLFIGDNRERFQANNYIDYSQFRRLWEARFGKEPAMRKRGADICWHVIRTYIKGMNPEGYLEPEDYESLPNKQKTVSMETYKFVFDKVWTPWYQQETAGNNSICWDDQDLVRAVIEKGEFHSKYAVVFCDEAQDFTRIELDLIYRLSLFTNRKLTPQSDIRRIPFAFAGDPFQTLNPTGFRWDAIKAAFHEKLVDSLRLSPDMNVPFNYQELRHNYRSTRNIVRLCNAIQLFRAATFDIPSLSPQISWQAEQNSQLPIMFDRDNPATWQNNLENETDITIIVPCLMGEEGDFVRNDPFLRKIVQCDDAGTPNNVLSPARAKGLEFNRVVLYSFGISAPEGIVDAINDDSANNVIDKHLDYEYFLNRLYVAASRPKKRLFIVDSDEGREKLWKIVVDENVQQRCFERLGEGSMDDWIEEIGSYQLGTIESWAEDRGNTEEIAAMYEQQGIFKKDPYLLRSAALSFQSINKLQKAFFCKGHALKIEGKLEKAAKLFADANDIDMSVACYWEGQLHDGIFSLEQRFPEVTNRLEYKFLHIRSNPEIETLIKLLGDMVEMVETSTDFQIRLVRESTWGKMLTQCIDRLKGSTVQWASISILTDKLISKGLSIDNKSHAKVYFHAGKYKEVLQVCNDDTSIGKNWDIFQSASKKVALDYYNEDKTQNLSQQDWEWISDELLNKNKYEAALNCILKTGNNEFLLKRVDMFPSDSSLMGEVAFHWLKNMEHSQNWDSIIAFGRSAILKKKDLRKPSNVYSFANTNHKNGTMLFVWLCATSSNIGSQRNDLLKTIRTLIEKVINSEGGSLNTVIPIDVVGTALENVDTKFKDILKFYETAIAQDDVQASDKLFSKVHWISTQEKYAAYEENNGKAGTARKKRDDIIEHRSKWAIDNETEKRLAKLDKSFADVLSVLNTVVEPPGHEIEYPADGKDLPTESIDTDNTVNTESLPVDLEATSIPNLEVLPPINATPIEIEMLGLKITYSHSNARVNFEGSKHKTASIYLDKGEFRSIDLKIEVIQNRAICKEWDVVVEFTDSSAIISFEKTGVALSFARII